MSSSGLPCGVFDYTNLNGTSLEYVFFISPHCLDNRFVYILHITCMSLYGLAFLIFFGLLLWNLVQLRRLSPPTILLGYATVTHFCLFLSHLSNFFAFRGVLRQFIQGLPFFLFFSGLFYVTYLWLKVILANLVFKDSFLKNHLKIALTFAHLILVFFPYLTCLISGGFDIENFHMNNLLISITLTLAAMIGFSYSVVILFVGSHLIKILNDGKAFWSSQEESGKMNRLIGKINRFTKLQGISQLIASFTATSFAIWGFATFSQDGPVHFFYVYVFFFEVTFSIGSCAGAFVLTQQSFMKGSSQPKSANNRETMDPKKVVEFIDEMKISTEP